MPSSQTENSNTVAADAGHRVAFNLPVPLACLLMALPVLLFYGILFRHSLNVPMFDDYDECLDFINGLALRQGFAAKFGWFLSSQQHEYKLFFEHAVYWLDYALFGHLNLRALCTVGNGFVLLLGGVLWKMFLPRSPLAIRLTLFVPVPWLLFQLQYVQTLNMSSGTLEHLTELAFTFAAIYLVLQPGAFALCGAILAMLAAVGSSTNSFLLVPIGVVVLARARRYRALTAWIAATAFAFGTYFFHYQRGLSLAASHPASAVRWPGFTLAFLGGAASYPIASASLVLGAALCVFFAWLTWKGYFRRSPAVGYSVGFLLVSAAGVAVVRAGFGVMYGTSSRYTIYSMLCVIFVWFAIAELFLEGNAALRKRMVYTVTAAAILFSVAMDLRGIHFERRRNADLIRGIQMYEHPEPSNGAWGPINPAPGPVVSADQVTFNQHAREVLTESARLGVYVLPRY